MRQRNAKFNTKRRMRDRDPDAMGDWAELAKSVSYGGNPEHKKNPGDFGLTPPSAPRPGKSLCDTVEVFSREVALKYLRSGLKRGLVSERETNGWPQNIWSVTDAGEALEAQLENPELGSYHGYPMPASDPMSSEVVRRWNEHNE